MQVARDSLNDGGRVIWVCEKTPDAGRFSQIFQSVDVASLARLHMMECGETISHGVQAAGKLAEQLTPQLFVIDDWTPRTGRANKITIGEIEKILPILQSNQCRLLFTSALYGDASGKQQWKVRGENSLLVISPTTWQLTVSEGGLQQRTLKIGDEKIRIQLTEDGFD